MHKLKLFASLLTAIVATLIATPASAQVVAPVPIYLSDRSAAGSITTTGTCPGSSCVVISAPGAASVSIGVTGTWVATLAFQGSFDGVNFFSVPAYQQASLTTSATSTTADGNWYVAYAGLAALRVNATAYTSGTAAVTMEASAAAAPITGSSSGAVTTSNSTRVSYSSTAAVNLSSAAQSLAAIEADASNKLRLRYIKVCLGPTAIQGTAAERTLVLFRSTAAGTGGSLPTPNPLDPADSAFGGVERVSSITTTPAVGSVTVANSLWSGTLFVPAVATATSALSCVEHFFDLGGIKSPTVAAGTSNGIALADITGGAGAAGTVVIDLEWTVEAQ